MHKLEAKRNFAWLDWGILVITFVFLSLTLPIILGTNHAGYSWDEENYHLPTVNNIIKHWPFLDIQKDSLSAIAPGYHYFLGTLSIFFGSKPLTLRFVNLIISFLILLCLYIYLRKYVQTDTAFIILMPLVTCSYFIKSSCWIITDNAAILLATITIISLFSYRISVINGFKIGFFASLTTLVRQSYVFLSLPLLVRNLFLTQFECSKSSVKHNFLKSVNLKMLFLYLTVLSPIVVLGYICYAWGGLVPIRWVSVNLGFSFSPLAYILSLFGFFGIFYLNLFIVNDWRKRLSEPIVIVSLLFGLIISIFHPTFPSYEMGRWGGYFWLIATHLPIISQRSILLLILSPLGAAAITIALSEINRRGGLLEARVLLASIVGWSLAFLFSRQVFQRYFEPMVLVFFVLMAANFLRRVSVAEFLKGRLLLLSLSLFQVFITVFSIFFSP